MLNRYLGLAESESMGVATREFQVWDLDRTLPRITINCF